MDLPTALLLGIVQGLTEWLPVSSSGHLVIFEHLSDVRPPLFFNIALHLGTLLAAGWLLREDILRALRATPRALRAVRTGTVDPDERTVLLVLLASIPTAIIGYSFDTLAASWLGSLRITGAGLLATAGVLWLSRGRGGTLDTVTVVYTDANDQAPSVWICVNNCASDNRTLDPADWDAGTLSDGDYANGELFFIVNTFPVGTHTLTAGAHDTLNMSNSLSGDLTVRDDIPRLSDAAVSPASGGEATSFNFTVVFTDFDNRDGSVSVNVGAVSHAMSANGDGNTSDGEEFYWTGTVAWGSHDFYFSADNGLNDAVNLSGGSVTVNDAPAFTANGTAVRVNDTYTFTANVSDANEDDGDVLTVWADIAYYGTLALASNGDGTYSASLDLADLIGYGGDRTATFGAQDSTGAESTGDAGTASFFVDIIAGFSLAADSDAKAGPPNGEVDYTFTITNTGNH